jgi:glycosyltransferase involved in cell wall biosynthesis
LLGLVILEAVALGTLPIVSDIPPFLEIMRRLGLGDFVYPEGDRQALRSLLMRHRLMGDSDYFQIWSQAREKLIAHYLWDDFALRFKTAVHRPSSSATCAS